MERSVIVGRAFYVVVWLGGRGEIQISNYFLNAISFFLAAFGSAGSAYAVVAENSSKKKSTYLKNRKPHHPAYGRCSHRNIHSWNTAVFRPATRVVFGACYFCWFGTADGDWNMVERRILSPHNPPYRPERKTHSVDTRDAIHRSGIHRTDSIKLSCCLT